MMPIETVVDVMEALADQVGVYGAHDDENGEACQKKPCRVCWTSEWEDRIRAAFAVEAQLERGRKAGQESEGER